LKGTVGKEKNFYLEESCRHGKDNFEANI